MPDKCEQCRRKSHFTVVCKCEKVLCIEHRDPYDHICTFEYKTEWKKQLTLQNPVVKHEKVESI